MIEQINEKECIACCDWCAAEQVILPLDEVKNNIEKYRVLLFCSSECEEKHNRFVEFSKDFTPYIDKFGLVTPNGQQSGNGLLYTSEAIIAMADNDIITPLQKQYFFDVFRNCEIIPGLFRRDPENLDYQEGPDDYVGIAAASPFISFNTSGSFASRILRYGRLSRASIRGVLEKIGVPSWIVKLFGWIKVKYNYNNVTPGETNKGSWLGRQGQLITHFQFAAGENPWMWRKVWWCGAVLSSLRAPKDDTDSYILSWLLVRTAAGKSILCNITIKIWYYFQNKRWPGGISQVLREYFQHEHPLVKWLANSK